MTEQFANHPLSLGERRAEKTGRAKDWAPRDVLIAMLREIDSGAVDVDALIVSYRCREAEGESTTRFMASSPDGSVTLGLLARASHLVNAAAD